MNPSAMQKKPELLNNITHKDLRVITTRGAKGRAKARGKVVARSPREKAGKSGSGRRRNVAVDDDVGRGNPAR